MSREMNTADLLEAVESGYLAEVQRILKHNPDIDVDALNEIENTPFLEAIRKKHKPIIECLLAHGASVNGPVGAWRTPLQLACLVGKADIVSLLLEHGADIDAMTARSRRTPLTEACIFNTKLDITRLLIDAGADLNGVGGDIAPLHHAAFNGNTEAVELLIQSGADVNILSSRGYGLPAGSTPLHFAAVRDSLDCINSLLAAGADSNIANSEGRTPLHLVALHSSFDVITALLDAGCDPLHQDNDGRTPLQHLYHARSRYMHFYNEKQFNMTTTLVAAGDRSWECVPTPCPGLEAAMLSVWQAAPDEMPEMLKRAENPPQNLIELYARMDDDAMKKVVQEVLRVLHHHFVGFPHLKEHLLNSIFGLGTV